MPKKKKEDKEQIDKDLIIEEGTPEADSAAAAHDAEQQKHMADLDDPPIGSPILPEAEEQADPGTKPPDEPADKEQESQPDKAEAADTEQDQPAEDKQEVEPQETTDTKADDPDPTKTADEDQPKDGEKPDFITGDRYGNFDVEVVSEEGAKSVPLNNLVITYNKYSHLQRVHKDAKPIFDLADRLKANVSDLMPFIELGVQAYMDKKNIVDGNAPPTGETRSPSDAYQGPFESAEEDAYYKEVDPNLHAAMHRMHAQASGGQRIAQLESEIENLKQAAAQPQTGSQADPQAEHQQQEAQKAFDDRILNWSGEHTDYFTAPNVGEARLNAFKNFIIKSHGHTGLKIGDLSPEFLSAEFARFDPRYNLQYMKDLASKKAETAKDGSGMFAEGSSVRTTAEPLDEQQKHMADM